MVQKVQKGTICEEENIHGKNFPGEKFRHLPKISSLFPDEIFPR